MWRWRISSRRNYCVLRCSPATTRGTSSSWSSSHIAGPNATWSTSSEHISPTQTVISLVGLKPIPVSGNSFILDSCWTRLTFYQRFASRTQNRGLESRVSDETEDANEDDGLDDDEYTDDDEGDYEEEEDEEEEMEATNQEAGKKKVVKKAVKPKPSEQQGRVLNEAITAQTVRLVLDGGEGHKLMSREEALRYAKKRNLDLVQVDGRAKPPVCKVFDFHKEEYRQEQIHKDRKKKKGDMVRLNEVKELRFTSKTELKDLKMKVDRAKKFMDRGHRVKFVAIFKGGQDDEQKQREQQKMIDDILEMVQDIATVEQGPRVEARQAWVMLRHLKFGAVKKRAPVVSSKSSKEGAQSSDATQGQGQSKDSIAGDPMSEVRIQEGPGLFTRPAASHGQHPHPQGLSQGAQKSDTLGQPEGIRGSVSQSPSLRKSPDVRQGTTGMFSHSSTQASRVQQQDLQVFPSQVPFSRQTSIDSPPRSRVPQGREQDPPRNKNLFSYPSAPQVHREVPEGRVQVEETPGNPFSYPPSSQVSPQAPLGRAQSQAPINVPLRRGQAEETPTNPFSNPPSSQVSPQVPLGRDKSQAPINVPLGRGQGAPLQGPPHVSLGRVQGVPSQAPPHVPVGRGQGAASQFPPQVPVGRGQGAPWLSSGGYPTYPPPSQGGPSQPFVNPPLPPPAPPVPPPPSPTDPLHSPKLHVPPPLRGPAGRGQGAPWLSSQGYPWYPPPPAQGGQSQAPPNQYIPPSSQVPPPSYGSPSQVPPSYEDLFGSPAFQAPPPSSQAPLGRGQGAPWLSSRYPPASQGPLEPPTNPYFSPPPPQAPVGRGRGAPWLRPPGSPPPLQGYPGYPPPPPPPPPAGQPSQPLGQPPVRYPPPHMQPPGPPPVRYPTPHMQPPGQPPVRYPPPHMQPPGQPPVRYPHPSQRSQPYPPSTDPQQYSDEFISDDRFGQE